MDSQPYEYASLECFPIDTIRLLSLRPGRGHEGVHCTISNARLQENRSYAALSYEWGDSESHEIIKLNHKRFSIRKNLWICLTHIRDPLIWKTLWVDAICVDQQNIPERNLQVQLMSSIFKGAKSVLAWLGEDTTSIGLALKRLCHSPFDNWQIYSTSTRAIRLTEILVLSDDVRAIVLDAWSAIADLCQRSYWNRTWIVQEIMLAHHVDLHFGSDKMSWIQFIKWCDLMTDLSTMHEFNSGLVDTWATRMSVLPLLNPYGRAVSLSPVRLLDHARCPGGTRTVSLYTLIQLHSETKCSDPRDKIYALLSLASDGQALNLVPDYGKSTEDLFFDVLLCYPGDWRLLQPLQRSLELTLGELRRGSALRDEQDIFYNPIYTYAKVRKVLHYNFGLGPFKSSCFRPQFVLLETPINVSGHRFDGVAVPDGRHKSSHTSFMVALVFAQTTIHSGDVVFKFDRYGIYILETSDKLYYRTYPCTEIAELPLPLSSHSIQSVRVSRSEIGEHDHYCDGQAVFDREMLLQLIQWRLCEERRTSCQNLFGTSHLLRERQVKYNNHGPFSNGAKLL